MIIKEVKTIVDHLGITQNHPPIQGQPIQNVILLSPHPDDECINGALALKLKYENAAKITNLCFSLGSDSTRQEERKKELEQAVKKLGFENYILNNDLKEKLEEIKPEVIIFPHGRDAHKTHQKCHQALMDIAANLTFDCALVEWEYWSQIPMPNLAVEFSPEIVSEIVDALKCHQGEIQRSAYHLTMPCWMADNTRRAQEIINGHQSQTNLAFSNIYHLKYLRNGTIRGDDKKQYCTINQDIKSVIG